MPKLGLGTTWLLKFDRSNETLVEVLNSFNEALDRAAALNEQENTTLLSLSGPHGKRLDGEAILKVLQKPLTTSGRGFKPFTDKQAKHEHLRKV